MFSRKAAVVALALLNLGIVATGSYCSYDVHSRRVTYYSWRDAEIRNLSDSNPTRVAVLQDDLLEAMYFDGQAVATYLTTLGLACVTLVVLALVCFLQGGRIAWWLFALSTLIVVLFAVHNLVL